MLINKLDNVEVNLSDGHKYAARDILCGENIIKYGNPIGHATADIQKGEHVHSHNMKTNLSGVIEYTYTPFEAASEKANEIPTFMGYLRENGDVGIRNELWIIPTVGCINDVAKRDAKTIAVTLASTWFAQSEKSTSNCALFVPNNRSTIFSV